LLFGAAGWHNLTSSFPLGLVSNDYVDDGLGGHRGFGGHFAPPHFKKAINPKYCTEDVSTIAMFSQAKKALKDGRVGKLKGAGPAINRGRRALVCSAFRN
jgi:hypothetical protein